MYFSKLLPHHKNIDLSTLILPTYGQNLWHLYLYQVPHPDPDINGNKKN